MKYVALGLVASAAFVAILSNSVKPSIGPEFSILELILALLFVPALIVSSIGAVSGLVGLLFVEGRRKYSSVLLAVGLVAPIIAVTNRTQYEAEFEASYAWHDQLSGAGQLNFHLHNMILEDRDLVRYLDESELIEAEPLLRRLSKAGPLYISDHSGRKRSLEVSDNGILTPWGSKIYFAVDRNGDGFISALGQTGSTKYGVSNPFSYDENYSYVRATGVLLSLPDQKISQGSSSIVTLDDNDYDRLRESWIQSCSPH